MAFFVKNHAVQIDIFERYIIGDIQTEHNHAANPLEQEVGASLHNGTGVEFWVRVGGDVGPLARTEPGIEGVVVAEIFFAVDGNFGFVYAGVENPIRGIFGVDESRDGDTPRNLARDVPVTNVF